MVTAEQPDETAAVPADDATQDALELATEQPLSATEQHYVRSARAANTLRGYQLEWNEFHHWCADHHQPSMPTSAAAISTYLTALGMR